MVTPLIQYKSNKWIIDQQITIDNILHTPII